MDAIEAINGGYGRYSMRLGGLAKRSRGWEMKRGNRSLCYKTRLDDLVTVRS